MQVAVGPGGIAVVPVADQSTAERSVVAVDPTGEVRWRRPVRTYGNCPPSVAGDDVWLFDQDASSLTPYALDSGSPDTGRTLIYSGGV